MKKEKIMRNIKVTPTERKILDAIKAAKAQGIKIVQGLWAIKWDLKAKKFVCENNCCCPLGAVLITQQPEPPIGALLSFEDNNCDTDSLALVAAKSLGKNAVWVEGFINAYDDEDVTIYNSAQKAGSKVRELLNL